MRDWQRILVGADFSEATMAAARRGADLAHCYGAGLISLHVIEHFPEDMPNDPIAPKNLDPATFYRERARQNLADVAEKIDHMGAVQEVITINPAIKYIAHAYRWVSPFSLRERR